MDNEKRSPRDIAKAIENSISDVRKVLYAVPVMKEYDFFNLKKFEMSLNNLIKNSCNKYNVKEDQVRKIAGWNAKIDLSREVKVND